MSSQHTHAAANVVMRAFWAHAQSAAGTTAHMQL